MPAYYPGEQSIIYLIGNGCQNLSVLHHGQVTHPQSRREPGKQAPIKKPPPIPWEGFVVRPGMYRVGVSEEGIPDQLQGLDAPWRDNGDLNTDKQYFRPNGVVFVPERHFPV